MTHFATDDPRVALGVDSDPRLDPLDGVGIDLDAQLARLQAVVAELAVPPVDRDPVLWSAHEFARCAQLLIAARAPGAPDAGDAAPAGAADPAAHLGPALDHARSAMLSLTMARRSATP